MSEFMGEAIALSSPSGRMSNRARKAALKRLYDNLFSRQEIKPMPVKTVTVGLEPYQIGQKVIARFTNSGRVLQFEGVIVGRTKNYWKVEAINSPYENEAPGRVYHIFTWEAKQYSANNRIIDFA